jgi:hypothetical protein
MRHRAVVGLFVVAAIASAAMPDSGWAASSAPPRFDGGQILKDQGGGEPSIAVDTSATPSRNDVYVDAIGGWGSAPPPGDPSGSGPVLWHSSNGGATFSAPVAFDTGPQDELTRGGDADTVVAPNGNVIVTDLNLDYAWVQVSTDHGETFNAGTATAPEDDRPWLAVNGNTVYVAYHDFTAEVPGVCTSLDGGQTFVPACSYLTITDPTIATQCAENTIPARALAIDPTSGVYHDALNFVFSCSTATENLQHPPYGPLHDYYLAQSLDGGLTWQDYPIFLADTSGGKAPNYANIFGTLAIDSAGNYYMLMDGTANDNEPAANPYHVYLLTSTDHGHTWSAPKQVDHDPNGAGTHVLAHMAVTGPGNIDVAWYGTSATGEPNGVCGTLVSQSPCTDGFPRFSAANAPGWNVYMAQSTNALSATPRFAQAAATSTPVHYGEICTNGIVCGNSDRTLLDFLSVGVGCNGLAHLAFAGNTKAEEAADFENGAANIHVVNQIKGGTLAAPAPCLSTATTASGP